MTYTRLVHKNPKLNDKNIWYRLVERTDNGAWYLCTIWGPHGMINSTVHAVPCEEYLLNDYTQKDVPAVPVNEDEEFF